MSMHMADGSVDASQCFSIILTVPKLYSYLAIFIIVLL